MSGVAGTGKIMKGEREEEKPTLGIKIVLTILCVIAGAIAAFYWFSRS